MNEQSQKFTDFIKRHYELLLLVLVVLIFAVIGFIYYRNQNPKVASQQSAMDLSTIPIADPNAQPQELPITPLVEGDSLVAPTLPETDPATAPVANTNVNWQTPAKLPDQKLILGYGSKAGIAQQQEQTFYYQIGTHGSNKIILVEAPAQDPSGEPLFFFEKTDKGFVYMAKSSENDYAYRGGDTEGYVFSAKLITGVDSKSYYSGIVGPNNLNWSGITLNQPYLHPSGPWESYYQNHSDANSKIVAKLPVGDLYQFEILNGDPEMGPVKLALHNFVLKLPSGLYTPYYVKYNFVSDNSVPNITWLNGTKNTDPYRTDGGAGGCGNVGAFASPSTDVSNDIKQIGTTSTGIAVYEFKDINNSYMQYYYKLQAGMYYDPQQEKQVSISKEEWAKHHPLIILKNGAGDYIIMSNQTYGLSAECGKPVVYLYPSKPTKVSVKVGATITKSEPAYNSGWTVTANPNGQLLTADGAKYDSLFWEGTGFGQYPSITEGFIVKHADIETTLTKQLAQLGLNDKEASDFKEFWLSKMPNTPYVRFTWFTNKELDRLAPLVISPRPNTVIRVFLDFQGIDTYVPLPEQKLTSIPRNGFTAVEWGGLLK